MVVKEIVDFVCVLTFEGSNGNMLSSDDIKSLLEYLDLLEADDDVCGVILTGRGRSFSAGLESFSVAGSFNKEMSDCFFYTFDRLLIRLFSFPKPVVAAVNGHSIGGGLLLQCCADFVYIADNEKIKLGFPEFKMGLTIDLLMQVVLNFSINNSKVLSHLLYSSEYFGIQKSLDYGLVDRIVPLDSLMALSFSHLKAIAVNNKSAFAITKQLTKSDCVKKMQNALSEKCYCILTELLTEKYCEK